MIKTLQITFTLLAIACIVAGIAILAGRLDAAFLISVPETFNQPCGVTLILTGAAVLLAPLMQKYRK